MRFKNNQRRFRTCEFLTKKYTRWFFKMSDIRSECYYLRTVAPVLGELWTFPVKT